MVTILILLYLGLGIYSGARRGLAVQLIHLIGYAVTLIIAFWRFRPLSRLLEMYVPYPSFIPGNHLALFSDAQALGMDSAFYQLFSFFVITMLGWLVVRVISVMILSVARLPIIRQFNTVGGAIFGVLFHYVTLFIVLSLLAMVPNDSIQALFQGNSLATLIVRYTPILSSQVLHLITG